MGQFLTASMNVDGITRKLEILINQASDLNPVLKEFGGVKRAEVKTRFDSAGPGWEALKESTLASKPSADHVALLKIIRKQRRGGSRLQRAGVLKTFDQAESYMIKARTAKTDKVRARHLARAATRFELLDTLVKKYGHAIRLNQGLFQPSTKIEDRDDLVAFAEQDLGKRQQRLSNLLNRGKRSKPRYKAEASSARILGKLGQSIGTKLQKGRLIISCPVPWASVHNEGGTAGNGAKIPARTFLEWTSGDMATLVAMLRAHFLVRLLT